MKRVYRTGGYAESIEDRRLCREYRGQEVMQRGQKTGVYVERIKNRGKLCREDKEQGEIM